MLKYVKNKETRTAKLFTVVCQIIVYSFNTTLFLNATSQHVFLFAIELYTFYNVIICHF